MNALTTLLNVGRGHKNEKYYYFGVVMRTPLTLNYQICAETKKKKKKRKKKKRKEALNIFLLLILHFFNFAHKDEHTRLLFVNISIRILQTCTNNGSNKAILMSAI